MKKLYFLLFLLLITMLLFISFKNNDSKIIKIGFIAGLSGKYSSLGHSVKNGASLALEENNYLINNKEIEFILKDDKQDKNIAKQIIKEFIKNDIKIILGNTTSSMTKVSLEEIKNKKGILLISATASSGAFSDLDDNFLRTQVATNHKNFNLLTKYLVKNSLLKISLIYDDHNLSFTNSFSNSFEKSFLNNGGNKFISKIKINQKYENILEKLNKKEGDLILIIASSLDSSKLIQYLKINKFKQRIICSDWARTNDFITNGGKAVENVLFLTSYDDSSKTQVFLNFVEKYKKRYKKEPSVFAAQAYETINIIIKILKKDGNISNLKNNIIKVKNFEGLQGNIEFTKYGDVKRDSFLLSIKNSKFVRLNKI